MLDIEKLKGVYLEPLCDENYDLEDEETLVKEAIASLEQSLELRGERSEDELYHRSRDYAIPYLALLKVAEKYK